MNKEKLQTISDKIIRQYVLHEIYINKIISKAEYNYIYIILNACVKIYKIYNNIEYSILRLMIKNFLIKTIDTYNIICDETNNPYDIVESNSIKILMTDNQFKSKGYSTYCEVLLNKDGYSFI
jgi:hypothetical protein